MHSRTYSVTYAVQKDVLYIIVNFHNKQVFESLGYDNHSSYITYFAIANVYPALHVHIGLEHNEADSTAFPPL